MRVVDTSVWIEWLIDSPLGKRLSKEMPDKDSVGGTDYRPTGIIEMDSA